MTISVYNLSQPCIAGSVYSFPAYLFSQADTKLIKTSPTLATGDVKISLDGLGFTDITTLPIQVETSGELTVSLSALETTGATKYITVKFSDVSGAEWNDTVYILPVLSSVSVPTAQDIWGYVARSLTSFDVSSLFNATVDTTITIYKYTTDVITVTNVSNESEIWFTVKQNKNQLDSESIIQVSKTTGLIYINGMTAILAGLTSADASCVISGSDLLVTLSAAASAKLSEHASLFGEVKTKTSGGVVSIVSQFDVDIVNSVGRAI